MKRYFILLMGLLGILLINGCAINKDMLSTDNNSNVSVEENGYHTQVIGSISHHMKDALFDNEKEIAYIEYSGGELEFVYTVKVEEMNHTPVGFMIYVDGMPQAFRTEQNDEYKYMQVLELEDGVENDIQFAFTPSVKVKEKEASLCIASIFNPEFVPDMENAKGYGIYHHMTEAFYGLKCAGDFSESFLIDETEKNISILLNHDRVCNQGEQNQGLSYSLSINNQDVTLGNCYCLSDNDNYLQVILEIHNAMKIDYRCSFYINHEAMQLEPEAIVMLDNAIEGEDRIEVTFDAAQMNKINSFYAVILPVNANCEEKPELLKTNSVCLIKADTLGEDESPEAYQSLCFVDDFSGYVCPIEDDKIMLLGEKFLLLSRTSLSILAQGDIEELPFSLLDLHDCTVCKCEEGYMIGGTIYHDNGMGSWLALLIVDDNLNLKSIVSVEEAIDCDRSIMKFEFVDNGRKLLYTTMMGLELFDWETKAKRCILTEDYFIHYFAYDNKLNRVLYVANDRAQNRILGYINVDLPNSSQIIDVNATWGKIHIFDEYILIEEDDVFGKKKSGILYCYDYENTAHHIRLNDLAKSTPLSVSSNGMYYALKDVDNCINLYPVKGTLIHYEMKSLSYDDKELKMVDMLIDEDQQVVLFWGYERDDQNNGLWLMNKPISEFSEVQ